MWASFQKTLLLITVIFKTQISQPSNNTTIQQTIITQPHQRHVTLETQIGRIKQQLIGRSISTQDTTEYKYHFNHPQTPTLSTAKRCQNWPSKNPLSTCWESLLHSKELPNFASVQNQASSSTRQWRTSMRGQKQTTFKVCKYCSM